MNILAIIQVRYASKRFPHKALVNIDNKTILQHIVSRLQKIQNPNFNYIFAVASKESNLIIEELQNELFYLGSEDDVLERFCSVLQTQNTPQKTDYIIRLTADNPFFDYSQINRVITNFKKLSLQNFDYAYIQGLPLGMGFEWISKSALLKQKEFPLKDYHREHVTIFIKENPKIFRIQPIPINFSLPKKTNNQNYDFRDLAIRLTLDEKADLEMLKKVYGYFCSNDKPFFYSKRRITIIR